MQKKGIGREQHKAAMIIFEDVFYKNRELMAKIRVEFAHILALREAIEAAVQNDGAYVDGIGLASSYEGPDEEDDDVLPQAPPLVRMRASARQRGGGG